MGILWIVHSLATTMYLPWQNRRQQEALEGFLTSVESALRIQENLSELLSLANQDLPVQQELKKELLEDLDGLQRQSVDPDSLAHIHDIEEEVRNWQAGSDSPLHTLDYYRLIETSQAFIRAQQRGLLRAIQQRTQTDTGVNVVRAVLLVLGLGIGIGLAIWMARGLRTSLAQINVTLQEAATGFNADLGQIEVRSEGPAGQLNVLEAQVQGVVANLHHVAEELQHAHNKMLQAERLVAVGELAAGVAHEIRNPLTSVKLLIQRAAEREPVHYLKTEQTEVLLEEISRMEHTVQSLLDFARPEKPQNVHCELTAILAKCLALLEGRLLQRQVQVELSQEPLLFPLYADPLLIQQVIVNIIINAIDFMPEGGTLWIRLTHVPDSRTVSLRILDSGPGIETKVLKRLFDPFVTTRTSGSGLGLAISRRVIEEQGGTLSASNSPAGGALFEVLLPIRPGPTIAQTES